MKKEVKESEKWLEEVLVKFKKTGGLSAVQERQLAIKIAYSNLGGIFLKEKNYTKSYKYLSKADKIDVPTNGLAAAEHLLRIINLTEEMEKNNMKPPVWKYEIPSFY